MKLVYDMQCRPKLYTLGIIDYMALMGEALSVNRLCVERSGCVANGTGEVGDANQTQTFPKDSHKFTNNMRLACIWSNL